MYFCIHLVFNFVICKLPWLNKINHILVGYSYFTQALLALKKSFPSTFRPLPTPPHLNNSSLIIFMTTAPSSGLLKRNPQGKRAKQVSIFPLLFFCCQGHFRHDQQHYSQHSSFSSSHHLSHCWWPCHLFTDKVETISNCQHATRCPPFSLLL